MIIVAETSGVSRSGLQMRLTGRAEPRRSHHAARHAAAVPPITALVAVRPTGGYRRITAIANRGLRATGAASVNPKRV